MTSPPLSAKNYRGSALTNYSALKTFSVCPHLYYEQYIAKTYVEPERDYFVYGSLVDCMLTTPDELDKRFVRVDRTVEVGNTLKFEQKIRDLEAELAEIVPKAELGNKTAQKGVAKREGEIEELRSKLRSISDMKDKQQVTAGMWDDALATAEAIRRNPTFRQLDFNAFTSQQILTDEVARRKGILDYVEFSPPVQTLYNLLKTNHIQYEEFKAKVQEVSEENRYGWIWDIKTTGTISAFDPSIYAGQLAWYRAIVESYVGIRCQCGIIAGDKDPSCKRSQDYVLVSHLLDEAHEKTLIVEKAFLESRESNVWPAAKHFRGLDQECFRCSECSERPFSIDSPLIVSGPLNLRKQKV